MSISADTLLAGRYRFVRRVAADHRREYLDEGSGRPVLVTFLHPPRDIDPTSAEKLRDQARAATQLSHPGIVPVHHIGVDGSQAFVVTSRPEGSTLADVLDGRGPLSIADVMTYADQICAALADAHSKGVLHRRLSPDRIVLDAHGAVQVADFGLPRLHHELGGAGPATTSSYLAPEQEGDDNVDARADLYALGAILTVLLTGHPPTPTHPTAESAADRQTVPPRTVDLPPDTPPVLDTLITDLLATDPEDRPSSALEATIRLAGGAAPNAGHVSGQAEVDAARDQLEPRPRRQWVYLLPIYLAVAAALILAALIFVGTH